MEHKIEYGTEGYLKDWVISCDGFSIAGDKHAYVCQKCGAVFQSKNISSRTLFETEDPRCRTCANTCGTAYTQMELEEMLKRVCKCKPIVGVSAGD